MTESQLKNSNELREAIIANLGGEYLAALDCLLSENALLKALETSVLKKAEMLRNEYWDISSETGTAGLLHAAITGLHTDLEGVAEQRDQLREKLIQL